MLVAMDAAPNRRSYIRLASIRALFMGMEREVVRQVFRCSDRLVRLWIECFNNAGIDGLTTKLRSGRPRKVKLKRVKDFEPMFLPCYSPDFNPIERLWLRVKADWFSDFIASDKTSLCDRLCTALKSFIDDPTKTASVCSIRK